MSTWNSLEDNTSQRSYSGDNAYQNGAFQDYALPANYRGDTRNNLAMSVSLGPVDLLLGGGNRFDFGRNHRHDDRYSRYDDDRYSSQRHGNQRFGDQNFNGFVSRPYLTPDYNFRKGYEDFGEASYIRQRGFLPIQRREQYMPPQDWRMQTRRAESFWDRGTTNCPEDFEQPRRQYVQPREVAPQYRRETVERETEQREPTRTLPTNSMSEYDWAVYQKLCDTAKGLVGKHTTAYDSRLPTDRLGCVKAASLLLDQGYGLNTNDVNTRQFEKDLREKNGFTEVAVKDLKPGDVILGYRKDGDYSHSAVYMGNGKIFNNDSDSGVMAIQSVDKFNSTEFKRMVILRRPAQVPSVPVGAGRQTERQSTSTSADDYEAPTDSTYSAPVETPVDRAPVYREPVDRTPVDRAPVDRSNTYDDDQSQIDPDEDYVTPQRNNMKR